MNYTELTDDKIKINVVWGSFTVMADGQKIWSHNPCLDLSREEQHKSNLNNPTYRQWVDTKGEQE